MPPPPANKKEASMKQATKHNAEYVGDLFPSKPAEEVVRQFERKRKANKIMKRTIKALIGIGYQFTADKDRIPNLDGLNEVCGVFGDIFSRHLIIHFKSIMDMNRRRYPNTDHILFERVMLTLYERDPIPTKDIGNLTLFLQNNVANFASTAGNKVDHIKFKGVAPRQRLAKLHALGVAKLLE